MMANCYDTDAVSQNSVEEVIGKAVQVGAAEIGERRMIAQWVCFDAFDGAADFIPELVSEPIGKLVVVAEDFIDVRLDGGVKAHSHRSRFFSTREMNSWCEISSAWPLSRSASRWRTSSSESCTAGGRVSISEAMRRARSWSLRARACSWISARLMQKG